MFKEIKQSFNYLNLVNGQWIGSKENIKIYSPVNKELLGTIPKMDKMDVDEVLKIAKEAQPGWADTPLHERAKILNRAADLLLETEEELSTILMKEIGKDLSSSTSEVKRTADFIRFTADAGKSLEGETIASDNFPGFKQNKLSFAQRVPVGVVLAISPFNYPINLSASKLAPALIAGNSVVLKPPTQGALSALHLVRILQEAGIPKGVINTITGDTKEIGDYLVTHKDIDFINFTGSSKVGKHIALVAGMVPMLMELGGKDAAIVLSDADLEAAGKQIVSGAYSYSGQRCTAIKRVLVLEDIAEEFSSILLREVQLLTVGAPEANSIVTPLINKEAADYVEELIQDALDKGAQLLCGNQRKDNLIYPTLLDKVREDMRVAWEEPFGPVLPIIRVKDKKEAIALANKSEYGLQSSIFTKNINDAFYIARSLQVGAVQINNKSERGPDHFPFTGVKASGMGTQGIRYSIEAMTRIKSIVLSLE